MLPLTEKNQILSNKAEIMVNIINKPISVSKHCSDTCWRLL